MLRAQYSLFVVLALFLATAHAQEANPPGTPQKKKNKIPGISTVIVVTGSKTDEAQQNVTQKVNVTYNDQVAAQATSARNISELLQYQPGISVTVLSRSDAIVDNVISSNPSQTKSVNAGNARSYGLELVYDHYINDRVHLFANYTRTASRIANPIDRDQDGAAISTPPAGAGRRMGP